MKNRPAYMTLFFRFTLLLIFTYTSTSVSGQLKGKVYDGESGLPLENVAVNCNNEESLTDKKGAFSLQSTGLVTINHLGYKPFSQLIDKENVIIYLEPNIIKLKEVLVKGPLMESQLFGLPASISILQKTELEQSWGISYIEQLNQLSGVYAHAGALNTNRITIRGIGSRTPYGTNRVKAFYNEIPLTSADGTTNIEDIDKALINRIDVIKGPKSAVYGAGLGGIILLADKKYIQPGFHGRVVMEAGIYDTYKPAIELSYKKNNFSVSSFYSNTQSAGFRENSKYNRHSGQIKLAIDGKRNQTKLLLHYIDLKAFIPSSINKETFENNPEQAAGNWLAVKGFEEYSKWIAGLHNEFKINAKLSNKTILYANLSDAYESRPFNILDDNNQRRGIKNYLNYSVNNWQVQVGFEIVDEKYDWEIFATNDGVQGEKENAYQEKRNSTSLFADVKWQSQNGWIIESGISYNFQRYQLDDLQPSTTDQSGNYKYKDIAAPFIGINIPLANELRFYGSYSYGFSYPTVEETLLPDGQINNNLKPEAGNSFEMGLRLSAFNNHLFVDAGGYLLLVDNLLVTERITEDIFTGKNAGSTCHMGFELSALALLNKKENYRLPSVKINTSFTQNNNTFVDFVDDDIEYNNNVLPGIPNITINSSIDFSYSAGWYLNLRSQYTGSQYLDDGNTESYESYFLMHIKTGYQLKLKNNTTLSFHLGVNNVLDENYASMILVNAPSFGGAEPRYYYPGQPKYLYGGIGFQF